MKTILATLVWSLVAATTLVAQHAVTELRKVSTEVESEKHLSSSILLWMRTDKPRQVGMDRWKGAHSKIISATKGLEEYRYEVHPNP